MTHLFDTNAWLRITQAPDEISSSAYAVLSASEQPTALSAISIWEVALKARRGNLQLIASLPDWLHRATRPAFVQVIGLDGAMARLAAELPGEFHADPADRFIVATALRLDLTVITSDSRILAYPHVRSLDTR